MSHGNLSELADVGQKLVLGLVNHYNNVITLGNNQLGVLLDIALIAHISRNLCLYCTFNMPLAPFASTLAAGRVNLVQVQVQSKIL